jgi:hypothetical protein
MTNCPKRPGRSLEKTRARVTPSHVTAHDPEIVGPVLLLAVLIYGTLQWSRRKRGPIQAVREEATRELYREGARAEKREEAEKASAGE